MKFNGKNVIFYRNAMWPVSHLTHQDPEWTVKSLQITTWTSYKRL